MVRALPKRKCSRGLAIKMSSAPESLTSVPSVRVLMKQRQRSASPSQRGRNSKTRSKRQVISESSSGSYPMKILVRIARDQVEVSFGPNKGAPRKNTCAIVRNRCTSSYTSKVVCDKQLLDCFRGRQSQKTLSLTLVPSESAPIAP